MGKINILGYRLHGRFFAGKGSKRQLVLTGQEIPTFTEMHKSFGSVSIRKEVFPGPRFIEITIQNTALNVNGYTNERDATPVP
jgi:hypothetical protein